MENDVLVIDVNGDWKSGAMGKMFRGDVRNRYISSSFAVFDFLISDDIEVIYQRDRKMRSEYLNFNICEAFKGLYHDRLPTLCAIGVLKRQNGVAVFVCPGNTHCYHDRSFGGATQHCGIFSLQT